MVVDQSHQQTRVEVARKEEILLEKISQQSQQVSSRLLRLI